MVISGNFQRKVYAQLRRPERKATAQAGYGQASPDGQCQVGKCKTSQPGSLFTNAVPTDLVQVVCPVTDDESMQYERKEHVRSAAAETGDRMLFEVQLMTNDYVGVFRNTDPSL